MSKYKVYLNAGHGGHDAGAVSNGLKEKDLTRQIVAEIRNYLKGYKGLSIKMTKNNRDEYTSLSGIYRDANKWNADLFVSVHINAGGGTGFEAFRHNKLSMNSNAGRLSALMTKNIVKETGLRNRGNKAANFAVLRGTSMPAVLTENGFIDNKSDADKLKKKSFIKKIAKGHADAILEFFNISKANKNVSSNTNSKPKPNTSKNTNKKQYVSLVNYLNDHNMKSDFNSRKKLANKYGIRGYKGTAGQNLRLLSLLQNNSTPVASKQPNYVGKRVESKVNNLRFYSRPSWADKHLAGRVKKGYGFPNILSKVKVGKGHQYKVKNSKGKVFYITASTKYVRVR